MVLGLIILHQEQEQPVQLVQDRPGFTDIAAEYEFPLFCGGITAEGCHSPLALVHVACKNRQSRLRCTGESGSGQGAGAKESVHKPADAAELFLPVSIQQDKLLKLWGIGRILGLFSPCP